ncbi:MAG: response regulator transcription factor, partial [Gaiellaceae bacterium]
VQSIVWAFNPEAETVLEAIRAGACGVLDKRIAAPALIRSLRGVMQGEAPLARDLTSRMIAAIHTLEQTQRARDRAAVLSTREREILEFVAQGAHNKQIASALTISEFTVKRHVQNILRKLELPSRRAAGGIYLAAYGPERALSANGRSV